MFMRSALFWDITQRRVVNNYHTTLRNIPEERRSQTKTLTMRIGFSICYTTQTVSLVRILATDLQSTVIDIPEKKK
jgi:hypothetical protein